MFAYDLPSLFWGTESQETKRSSINSYVGENEQEFKLMFELPGVEQADVDLEIKEDRLILKAIRKGDKGLAREFESIYKLPRIIDKEKVSAKLEKGILNVVIPKSKKEQAKKIKIDFSE